jgi:hypothetical protein
MSMAKQKAATALFHQLSRTVIHGIKLADSKLDCGQVGHNESCYT